MTTPPAELERTVRQLDGDVSALYALLETVDAKVTRIAGGQLRQASRLDQVEDRLTQVEVRLGGIDGRLDGIEVRLGGIDGRLDGIDGRLDGIDGRLDQHGDKLDRVLELLQQR